MYPRATYNESKEWQGIKDPVGMPKYDGANYFLQIDNKGEFHFFSRRPSVKGGFPDRTSQLPHLTSKPVPQFSGQVFNIELIHTGHAFSDTKQDHPTLSSILNALPERSIKTQEELGPVRAVLLNVIHPKINTFAEKLEHMNKLEKAFGKPEILRTTSTKIDGRAINDLVESSKKIGSEGVIITSLTTPEDMNKRLKIKHVNTWNLKVKKINQEYDILGNPKESAGSLTVVDSTGREVADVGTGFSKELRQEIWKNPKKWIGKEIQVKGRSPSRTKIIAPVYNGEPDGQMDKVAETLEDRLLENLVSTYRSKGVNLQKVLDNPLFQQLPLDKKVAFIEQAGSPIIAKPKFSYKPPLVGIVGGGIGGGMATVLHGAMSGGWKPGTLAIGVATGAVGGAIAGGLGGIIRSIMDRSRDSSTLKTVPQGGLTTLINRSGSTPIGGSPFGGNRYLEQLEGLVDTTMGRIGHTIGV